MDKADGASLARSLSTIGSATRISIMRQLRVPKVLREIEVERQEGGPLLARQSVHEHLEKLVAEGFVHAREVVRSYGAAREYLLNHQAIFALAEEVRELSRLRPAVESPVPTARRDTPVAAAASGPRLVLVKGLEEGTSFALSGGRRPDAWVIGRSRAAEIALDFDPFVSSENTVIRREGTRFTLHDLGSRNGTSLNFGLLGEDDARPLAEGDIVGVGKTLLVFRG